MDLISPLKIVLPFLLTLAATAFGFLLNQTWQKSKERKERLQKLISLLGATQSELSFYVGKLNALVNFSAEDFLKPETGVKGVVVPSFDFYPAYLEKARINLIEHHEAAEIIGIVGECHFELGHVQAKLENLRALATMVRDSRGDDTSIVTLVINSGGLKGLAKESIGLFTRAQSEVSNKLNEVRRILDEFYEQNLFGSILRE